MKMVVYWVESYDDLWGDGTLVAMPECEEFTEGPDQIKQVLNRCQELRVAGKKFITTASDHDDTSMGGIVRDGKLPNGEPYTWKKRRL